MQSTFSIRMDEKLKNEFEVICEEFGMSMTTAINIFARAVVREKRIPFEIKTKNQMISKEEAEYVFNYLRNQAINNGVDDMDLEKINEIIGKVREGK